MWPVLHQAVAVTHASFPHPVWIPNKGAWSQGKLQGLQQTKDRGPKNSGRSSHDPRTGNWHLRVEEMAWAKWGLQQSSTETDVRGLLLRLCCMLSTSALCRGMYVQIRKHLHLYSDGQKEGHVESEHLSCRECLAHNSLGILVICIEVQVSRCLGWEGVWASSSMVQVTSGEPRNLGRTAQLHIINMATAFSTNLKTEKPGPANSVCWFWASENSWFTSDGVCELSAVWLGKQQRGQASKPSALDTASSASTSSLRGRKRETESSYAFLSGCLAHWHMSAVVTGWLGPKGDRWFKSELERKTISPFQAFSDQKDECTGLRSFPHYFYLTAYRIHLSVFFLFPQPETDLLGIKIIFNLILDQFKSSLIISISLGYKD